jgi:outer membrane lipoprotein
VDRQVQFSDLQRDPSGYQGRLVVLGGRIAALRPSNDLTELEVTEFPLMEGLDSPQVFAPSRGQFLLAHQGPLDPGLYRPGRPITVVGLVQGGRLSPGQDVPMPILEPKFMHLWLERPPVRWFDREPLFLFPRRRFHRHFCD